MPIPDSLEQDALELEEKDRLHLLLKLLESFEPNTKRRNTMQNWVEEADTRYQSWKAGEMKTIPEEEVFREIRSDRKDAG